MTTETEVSNREPRKMESADTSVQRGASAQPEANKEEHLESSENGNRRDITDQDERQRLDYRSTVLTDWALAVSMVVNFAIIAGLVTFIKRPEFSLNTETWFALNAILISVGTGTVAHLQSLFLNLSRITPFMLCAAPGGALARDSILGSYVPAPSFRLILRTRN
ncbi:phosphoribosylaminoimidazole-succinocarboxamide synthase [Colletotrichum sojae]|uniref:Phosphoribosylaminoimidazole-succinocarboxamide synthase n=1 Tax=Colletotrichum sojae TaxID=2175907 RepID=A0A8H6IS90_9PEZI|nr:phosphoribosylaminoimidazole-succinocarboxamide synthase [Colletotrichum sojae]